MKENTFVAMMLGVCGLEVRRERRTEVKIVYVCGLCGGCFIFILWIRRALENLVFGIGLPIRSEEYRMMWRIFVTVILHHF